MLRTYTFPVDVTCGACTAHVESLIRDTGLKIKGEIKTDIISKITTVKVEVNDLIEDKTEETIKAALRDGCRLIEVTPGVESETIIDPVLISTPIYKKPRWLSWLLGGIGIASGFVMMALMLSGLAIPFAIMVAMGVLSAVISLALGGATIYNAAKNLKSGSLNMDTLYALGGLAAIVTTIAHLFIPGIPMLFDVALMIFGFKHIGDAVKEQATRPTERDMRFRDRVKVTVIVEPSGEEVELDKIAVGTIIRVPRDSIIPIDGILLDDEVHLYETLLNGDDKVKNYSKNKEVLSGFRIASDNTNSFVRIQTTCGAQDSSLSQLDKRLSLEKQQKPQIIAATENILRWFIPAVIVLAIVAAVILSACFFPALGLAGAVVIGLKCLIAVLVSACPCTLGLAAPLAANAGINKAKNSDYNVLFKNDEALRAAAQANVILLDLNGTLTLGKPVVTSFFTTKNHDKVLSAALALESHARHAFAKAVQQFSASKLKKSSECSTSDVITNRTGVSGLVNGERITIGNLSMMDTKKHDAEKYLRDNKITVSQMQQLSYIATDEEIIGHFVLEDPIRHGAVQTVSRLQAMGYEVCMCTGAHNDTAQAYSDLFKIKRVYANCKNIASKSDDPNISTKFSVVKDLQKEGNIVAMIGDAGNDAIPIAASHFGAAIKSASSDDITLNVADAVIESDSLLPVVALFEIARQTEDNIKQNIVASLSFNTLSIAAAITGTALTALGFVFPPAIGAGLMVLLLVPVIANVKRLENQVLPHFNDASAQAKKELGTSAELIRKFDPEGSQDAFFASGEMRSDLISIPDQKNASGLHLTEISLHSSPAPTSSKLIL